MISLVIPTTSTNQNYTDNIIKNIRKFYPNENEVEIIIETNDKVNLGQNYNNAVSKAKGEKIILLHNDMIIKPGFIETMDKHIIKNRITTYTRIEPPIFIDTYPGKILLDCGTDLSTFNEELFNKYQIEESLIDGGSQLFFGCLKEDYIKLDTTIFNPPQMWCSDDDLHLRYKLAGFEHKVSSAHVYHFVSKTSRATNDYQQIELCSNRNFVRKWGSRNPKVKYNIAFVIHNCNLQLLEVLEPWCDGIYVDERFNIGRAWDYVEMEQANTSFDLSKRVKNIKDTPAENIIIEFDATQLNNTNFQLIQQLPEIIHDSGEIGEFELDIFKITINSLETYEHTLINL
jgi:GT2 family glycosyltransferase